VTARAEDFFSGHPQGLAVYAAVAQAVASLATDGVEERVSTSQIAFRHHRGFAYVWRPGQYLHSDVPAVLSIALPRRLDSARVKEVAHPAPNVWMHHLELARPDEVDAEVRSWLQEAYDAAR
jgi:hypothetical protein